MSLQTYPGLDLNKVPKAIEKYLAENRIKPGDLKKFRLLGGVKNSDPGRKPNDPEMFYPASVTIPLYDKIVDPEAGVITVGAVRYFDDRTKAPVFKKYVIEPDRGNPIFTLRGSTAAEVEVYDFLLLSNKNKSNPFRDTSIEPLFEQVNDEKEAQERIFKRNALKESLDAISGWDRSEMQVVAAGYNISPDFSTDILRDKLEEIATKSPELFYRNIDSEDMRIKAVIKMAEQAGIVAYSAHQHEWKMSETGDVLATLPRIEGRNEREQFCEFLKTAVNGPAILENLRNMLTDGKSQRKPKKNEK